MTPPFVNGTFAQFLDPLVNDVFNLPTTRGGGTRGPSLPMVHKKMRAARKLHDAAVRNGDSVALGDRQWGYCLCALPQIYFKRYFLS